MQLLVPHIVTALQVSRRLVALDLRSSAAGNALDHLDTGIILVDEAGKVLFANRVAEVRLTRNLVLSIEEGALVRGIPDRTGSCAVADCADGSVRLYRSRHVIDIPRGNGRSLLRMIIIPFRPDAIEAALPELGGS